MYLLCYGKWVVRDKRTLKVGAVCLLHKFLRSSIFVFLANFPRFVKFIDVPDREFNVSGI
jgi:hypothetical protein